MLHRTRIALVSAAACALSVPPPALAGEPPVKGSGISAKAPDPKAALSLAAQEACAATVNAEKLVSALARRLELRQQQETPEQRAKCTWDKASIEHMVRVSGKASAALTSRLQALEAAGVHSGVVHEYAKLAAARVADVAIEFKTAASQRGQSGKFNSDTLADTGSLLRILSRDLGLPAQPSSEEQFVRASYIGGLALHSLISGESAHPGAVRQMPEGLARGYRAVFEQSALALDVEGFERMMTKRGAADELQRVYAASAALQKAAEALSPSTRSALWTSKEGKACEGEELLLRAAVALQALPLEVLPEMGAVVTQGKTPAILATKAPSRGHASILPGEGAAPSRAVVVKEQEASGFHLPIGLTFSGVNMAANGISVGPQISLFSAEGAGINSDAVVSVDAATELGSPLDLSNLVTPDADVLGSLTAFDPSSLGDGLLLMGGDALLPSAPVFIEEGLVGGLSETVIGGAGAAALEEGAADAVLGGAAGAAAEEGFFAGFWEFLSEVAPFVFGL